MNLIIIRLISRIIKSKLILIKATKAVRSKLEKLKNVKFKKIRN